MTTLGWSSPREKSPAHDVEMQLDSVQCKSSHISRMNTPDNLEEGLSRIASFSKNPPKRRKFIVQSPDESTSPFLEWLIDFCPGYVAVPEPPEDEDQDATWIKAD